MNVPAPDNTNSQGESLSGAVPLCEMGCGRESWLPRCGPCLKQYGYPQENVIRFPGRTS